MNKKISDENGNEYITVLWYYNFICAIEFFLFEKDISNGFRLKKEEAKCYGQIRENANL